MRKRTKKGESTKKVKKEIPKETLKMIAFKNHLSDLELNAIIKNENKKRKTKITPTTKMVEEEVNSLYRKYFGVNMKDRI